MVKLFYSKSKAFKLTAKRVISVFAAVCLLMLNVAATPSVQALAKERTIKKVIDPLELQVYNKTPVSDLMELLPKTVTVILSDKTNSTAAVTWDISKYDELVKSTKTFNLTGAVEGTKLKANIKVIVSSIFVTSIQSREAITVPNGTTVSELILPQNVSANMSDNSVKQLPVSWDTTAFNGNVSEEKKFVLTGDVIGTSLTAAIEVIVQGPWSLVWSDEFDGKGSKLDTNGLDLAKWDYQNGTGAEYNIDGWGNNEQQYYSKDNITVSNGNLVITPKMETKEGKSFTSSRIWTNPTFGKKYGKFEARVKAPKGQGFWPAFWMMPKNDAYGGWASSGEIDIMEARGQDPGQVQGTLHYGGSWPNNKFSGDAYHFPQGTDIGGFHTYAVEWEPGEIRWYVDGVLYQTQNKWYTNGKDGEEKYAFPAPFDQEFYIILNLAIGGNYIGNVVPGEAEFANKPAMEVDYVRVYELTGRPYKTPVEPTAEVAPLPQGARVPDSTGNYVNDISFGNGIKDNPEGIDADFGDGWNFIHNSQFGGQATAAVESILGRNFAKIDVTNAGSEAYSVQLEQHTTLGMDRWYEFSFDAKADRNRTLNAKLGGGAAVGWPAYSDSYTVNLTNEVQSFKRVFQMTKNTDIFTRIEFNCATATGPVWIGNVRLVEVEAPKIDPTKSKTPLTVSGNHVYNGAFDKYTIDRLAYWNLNLASGAVANMNVPEATRELNIDIAAGGTKASDVIVKQGAIQLTQNSGYSLTFKAKGAADRTAKVRLTSKDGATVFAEKEVNLTTAYNTFELPFTMENATDLYSNLEFMLGGNNSKVTLDDVKLIKTTIDYTGVDLYPLKNGDFSAGLTGWKAFKDGAEAAFTVNNGAAKVSVETLGTAAWNVMLMQEGMNITKGMEYTFSFRAKASENRDMLVTMENASYARAFDQTVQLTSDWQSFTYTVKPAADDIVALKYQLGKTAAGAAGDVYIDDVVFQVKNPPVEQPPMLIADETDNMVGKSIDITLADNAAWRAAISAVKINGAVLSTDKYTVTAGNINLTSDNFAEAGTYTIVVAAKGYADATVIQSLSANDGKLVQNGTFDTNIDGWSLWTGDGSNAKVTAENGEMKVDFSNYDGWFRWSTQVYQTGIKLQPGKTYVLKFDARSTLAKNVLVEINKSGGGNHFATPEVALAGDNQTYTYEFTVSEEDTDAKLNFLLGSNNVPGPNFAAHSIYLDNISIEEKTAEPPVVSSMIQNGTFDTNVDGWSLWTGDGSNAAVTADNGEMKVDFSNYDGWFRWSTQVYQTGLKLQAGKTYVLKFDARSTLAKNVLVELNKTGGGNHFATPEVALTTDMQTYTYEFTMSEADTDAKLNFLLGSNNVPGPNFTAHSIYLDNISLTEK